MLDDDRNSITHLHSQLKSTKEERDEAFKILRKMEEQHNEHLVKLRKKHADELEVWFLHLFVVLCFFVVDILILFLFDMLRMKW